MVYCMFFAYDSREPNYVTPLVHPIGSRSDKGHVNFFPSSGGIRTVPYPVRGRLNGLPRPPIALDDSETTATEIVT